ncbi:MAG TPA: phage tail protein, partial [Vitreimonas sp.]|nr:phage tail protein [Vitreimonas sp.]
DGDNNPVSSLTGKPMIEASFAWCWDARPFPAFPARADVWADGASWRRGHWLNGRAGLSALGEVVTDLCLRAGVEDADASALLGAVSGYVVDSPADARTALEPLMAAYDFVAGERDGQIVFFHRDENDPVDIPFDDLAERSAGAPFAQRGDAAETPIEARVRFLDAAKDYLVAGVSARRLDRAEGGVISVDAPLVLEAETADQIAQTLLADRRAAAETLRIDLGPAHIALEPGDRITLAAGDVFEIARIDDAEARSLDLQRVRTPLSASVSLGEPSAPPTPGVAPTPAFSILDLPLLPTAEADERPLAAVFASPWLDAHDIYAGVALTRRARTTQPAIMGELLWALWPGPVDRWDEGNFVRIKFYGGSLASAEKDAVLNGANVFAIDGGDGEWEIVQARVCELVAPNEYELRGFLRGQLGSAHAMRAPHPVGTRIVKLDQRLARADIAAHEWGEALSFIAPPAAALPTDARAVSGTMTLPHAAARPWAPAHLRARRVAGDEVEISWVRCARSDDHWGAGDPPLGAPAESYRLHILDGEIVTREVFTAAPSYLYAAADQAADFGAPPASLRLRVAQIGADGSAGLNKELTITL